MKLLRISLIAICLIVISSAVLSADRLPNATNSSNRQIPTSTYLEIIGMMDSKTQYQIDTSSHGAHEGGFLYSGETISSVVYKSDQSTNGGYLSQNKGLKLDEGPQQKGGYNIESQVVSTYLTDPGVGSKMTAGESIEMWTSGNYSPSADIVRNPVIADIVNEYIGGFNSHYVAKASQGMLSGQIASMAGARSVGWDTSVPAEIKYTLGIHPDMSTGMPFADGQATTEFTFENEEGSGNTLNMSQIFKSQDKTDINGMIFHFGKSFYAVSGLQPN